MPTGTVTYFDDAKGHGFITQEGAGAAQLFAHRSAIRTEGAKTLQEGQKVEFEVKVDAKGLQATNIRPL